MRCAVEGLGGEALSEAEITLRVRGGNLRWAVQQSWAVNWASLGPGEDLGAVGELEPFE